MENINNEVANLKLNDDVDDGLLIFSEKLPISERTIQSFLRGFLEDAPTDLK